MDIKPGSKVVLRVSLQAFDPVTKEAFVIEKGSPCTVLEKKVVSFMSSSTTLYDLINYGEYHNTYFERIPIEFLEVLSPEHVSDK